MINKNKEKQCLFRDSCRIEKNRLTTGYGGPRVTGNRVPIVRDVYTLDIRVIILLLVAITQCTR